MTRSLRALRLLLPAVTLSVLAVLGWQYSVLEVLAEVGANRGNRLVVLVSLTVLYLVRPFLLWPLSVFSVFIGFVFGVYLGIPLVLAGTLLTCLIPFYVTRAVENPPGYLDEIGERGSRVVQTTGELRGISAARLSPAPADVVSYGAGLSNVAPLKFAAGTLIGELPWAVFYVVTGDSLQSVSRFGLHQTNFQMLVVVTMAAALLVARPLYNAPQLRSYPEDEG